MPFAPLPICVASVTLFCQHTDKGGVQPRLSHFFCGPSTKI